MVLVDKTLEQMLTEIGDYAKVKSDTIVPRNYYINEDEINKPGKEFFWLDSYLNDLYAFLVAQGRARLFSREQLGLQIERALENALTHGHFLTDAREPWDYPEPTTRQDYAKPITVEVYIGRKGMVITVQDSGKGFHFQETVRQFRNREVYYRWAGKGFKVFDHEEYEVSGEGNRINILYILYYDNQ